MAETGWDGSMPRLLVFIQQWWWTVAELESWGSCVLEVYKGCDVWTLCECIQERALTPGELKQTRCSVNGHEACPLALSSQWVVELPSRVEGFNICFPKALVPRTFTDILLGRKWRSERDLATENSFSQKLIFKREGSELSFGLF